MLVKYKYQAHDNCPRCGQPHETTAHLLQCKGNGVELVWQDELQKLTEWMETQNLHPEIRSIIINHLQQWRINQPLTYTPSNPTLQQALYEQTHIGQLQFLDGFWSRKFETCQKKHLSNIKSLQSSQLLLSKTQRRIWKVAWILWEHRNNFLHDRNKSFHPKEIKDIQREIECEWKKGLSFLSKKYTPLFSRSLQQLLELSHINKLHWLATVWTAREIHNPVYLYENTESAEPLTRHRYLKWKESL